MQEQELPLRSLNSHAVPVARPCSRRASALAAVFGAALAWSAPAFASDEGAKADRVDAADLVAGGQIITDAEDRSTLLGSYLAGRFARSKREMDKAAEFFRDALARDPENPGLLRDAFFSEAAIANWDVAADYAAQITEGKESHWLAHTFLGVKAFRDGDYETAKVQFKAADAGPVGELTSRLANAWLLAAEGQPEQAIVTTDTVKQTWASSYRNFHRALIADLADLDAEAKRTFTSLFQEEPRTTRVALAYARHLARNGDLPAARSTLRAHLRATSTRDPQVDALLAQMAKQDIEGAKPIDGLVTSVSAGLGELFYEVGNTLATQGDVEAGTIFLQMALYVAPDLHAARFALAGVHDSTRHYRRAIATYALIPATSPLSFDAKLRRAYSLNSLKELKAARAELDILSVKLASGARVARARADEIASATGDAIPDEYRTLPEGEDRVRLTQELLTELGYDVGEIDGKSGPKTAGVLRAFQENKGLDSDGVAGPSTLRALMAETAPGGPQEVRSRRLRVLLVLGTLMRASEKFDEALGYYNRAIALIPRPQPQDWRFFYHRGVSYERLKQWPKAEVDLSKALELNPDQPQVLNYLGYTWVDRNEKLDQGMEYIRKAVRLKPNDGYIVDSLGWAYYRLGNFESAVKYLERAVELQPEDPTINDHLGDAYWRVGRKVEARYQWQQALDLKPEEAIAEVTKDKLLRGLPEPDETRVVQDATAEPAATASDGAEAPALAE